jgi:gliding motility-associated-like protein
LKDQNQYDPFEKMIQEKFDSMENSYNQSWNDLSKKIDKIERNKRLKKWGFISLLCIGLVTVFTINFNETASFKEKSITENKIPKAESFSAPSDKINVENTNEPIAKGKNKEIIINKDLISKKNYDQIKNTANQSKKNIEELTPFNHKNEVSNMPIENNEFQVEKVETIIKKRDSVLFISTTSQNFCTGDTLDIVFSSCNDCQLEWYINNEFHSNNSDGKVVLTGSGKLSFKLLAITSLDTLVSNSIDVFVEDVSDIKISNQEITESQITNYYFSAVSSSNLIGNYFWDFGDKNTSTLENPKNHFKDNGNYTISLVYTSIMGCSKKVYKTIEIIKPTKLLAPNSFTPNGDGLNDDFMPEELKLSGNNFTLTIYNKRGQQVFSTQDASYPWDGVNQKTGEKCQNDPYIWIVQMINESGEPEHYKGSIFLFK